MDIYSVPNLTCRKCYDTIDRHRLISILIKGGDRLAGFFNLIHKGWTLEGGDRGGRTQSERKASYRPYYVTSTSNEFTDREDSARERNVGGPRGSGIQEYGWSEQP